LFHRNEYANYNSLAHTVVALLGDFVPNFKLDSALFMWRTKSLRNRFFSECISLTLQVIFPPVFCMHLLLSLSEALILFIHLFLVYLTTSHWVRL
jgi:uncharacterized membrane protein